MYRSYNDTESGSLIFKSDFGAALEEPSPQGFGRGYVTYWETRNLRMASNNKPYLESYLNQMHDMRIVDAGKVLR